MKAFIVGGTGFVGVSLANRLLEDGCPVTVMGQSLQRPPGLNAAAEVVAADGRQPGDWQARLSESTVVINLAGASIFSRWTARHKRLIRDSRMLTTRHVVEALPDDASGIALFSTSAVGYYGFRGDERLNENSAPGDDFLARLCIDWEAEAMRASAKGARVVITRFGIVLGRNGGALGRMVPLFRLFLGGPLGSGSQWFSWIAMQDLIDAFHFLLRSPEASGAFNLTSPEPVRNSDLARSLGRALQRPAVIPAPSAFVRILLGEFGTVVLEGQRVFPERLLEAGFRFGFPEIDEILAALFSG